MIRVESFQTRAELEKRANELEQEGFELKQLAFRGLEPWAVFVRSEVVVEWPVVSGPVPTGVHLTAPAEVDGPVVNVTVTQTSPSDVASAIQKHMRQAPTQRDKPNRNRR